MVRLEDVLNAKMAMLGLIVAGVSTAIAYLISFIPAVNVQLATINVREAVTAGVSTDLAQRLIGFVSGTITLPTVLMVVIASILLVMLGRFISLIIPSPFGRTTFQRLWWMLAWGAVAGAVLINLTAGFGLDQMWTYVTLLIYSAILAAVIVPVYNALNLKLPAM